VAGSYTESLSSSVLNYKYENGRRYHAYREGAYILPNDEAEQRRLDMLHHIYRMLAGGALYYAPFTENNPPNRVLDLGTGTGIWAIDFADEYPNSVVIGTDLSPIQPIWVPPNCKFYVNDMESQWDYTPQEHFDYIHGRGLCGSVANWPKLFSQAYENLKPGGWFETQEFEINVYSDDGTLELVEHLTGWLEELNEASVQFGKPLRIANLLKGWMEDVGFVDVEERIVKVSIVRPWRTENELKLVTGPCRYLAQRQEV
jgi:SAM-dependent methyltransferase